MKPIDTITEAIIRNSITVHRRFGSGLLESTYEVCLAALLTRRGLKVERQLAMPVVFEGERLDCGYRLNILVDHRVVVELKTVANWTCPFRSDDELSGCTVGLLMNFNVPG